MTNAPASLGVTPQALQAALGRRRRGSLKTRPPLYREPGKKEAERIAAQRIKEHEAQMAEQREKDEAAAAYKADLKARSNARKRPSAPPTPGRGVIEEEDDQAGTTTNTDLDLDKKPDDQPAPVTVKPFSGPLAPPPASA